MEKNNQDPMKELDKPSIIYSFLILIWIITFLLYIWIDDNIFNLYYALGLTIFLLIGVYLRKQFKIRTSKK